MAITVESLEADLEFVQVFHFGIAELIGAIKEFEQLDYQVQLARSKDPESVALTYDELKRYNELKQQLIPQRRSSLNFDIPRLKEIASTYSLGFSDHWMNRTPGSGPHTPGNYGFMFPPEQENAVIRDLQLIRGAIGHHLRLQRVRESRAWYLKLGSDYTLPALKWFVKPEHSKLTLIAILTLILFVVLRSLGYDAKTIVEVVKAIRGGKE